MDTKLNSSNYFNNIFHLLPSNMNDQFQIGLKIILTSFEKMENDHMKEISELNEKLNAQENKLNAMKEENSKINEDLVKVLSENKYLDNLSQNLAKNLKHLEKFRSSILGSIETDSKKEYYSENCDDDSLSHKVPKCITKNNDQLKKTHLPINLKTELASDHRLDDIIKSKSDNFKFLDKSISNYTNKIPKSSPIDSNSIEVKINNLRGKLKNSFNEKNVLNQNYNFIINKNNESDKENVGKAKANRSSHYILSSKFFAECRTLLKREENLSILEILKNCNQNEISNEEAFENIKGILSPYPKLLSDFQMIFK